MRAETLLGATGCAAGSQMCSGTMPALTPKPNRKSRKASVAPDPAGMVLPQCVKAVEAITRRPPGKSKQETQDEAAGADVRHHEVEHAGVAGFLLFMLEADQAISGERHDLPGDQEEERVVGQENQQRREQ